MPSDRNIQRYFFYRTVIAFFFISKREAILLSGAPSKSFYQSIHGSKHKIATPAATTGFAMRGQQ